MAILKKARPLVRKVGTLRDTSLVVIATEGSVTEDIYFRIFGSTRVQVRVIPSSGGFSAPQYIFENLESFKTEYQLGEGDELWVAVDLDRWPAVALSQLAADCQKAGYGLAISNPCFEIWLALHFAEPLPAALTASNLTSHLKPLLGGYRKGKFDPAPLIPLVPDAIQRAQALDVKPGDRWPNQATSRVHLIASAIVARQR